MKQSAPQQVLSFFYYNLGGGIFFASGYAIFTLLYGLLGWDWLISKAISDGIGWTLNYLVQRELAFAGTAKNKGHAQSMRRLLPFSFANIPIDYAIVGGLKWLGVTPYIGLWISAIFFTIWKWLWYKNWVFK